MKIKPIVNKLFSRKSNAEKLYAALVNYSKENSAALKERSPKQIKEMVDLINNSTKDELNQPINGKNLLQHATLLRNFEMAEILVDNGINVNFKGVLDNTPLHDALAEKELNLSLKLLNYGANPTVKNIFKVTPIETAEAFLLKNDLEIFKKTANFRTNFKQTLGNYS